MAGKQFKPIIYGIIRVGLIWYSEFSFKPSNFLINYYMILCGDTSCRASEKFCAFNFFQLRRGKSLSFLCSDQNNIRA
jgi:hypothetical protein